MGPNCEGCEDPRECEMMPGVGGGAHISPFGYWSSSCPLQDSPYATPLVWRVDSERFFMESGHTEQSRTLRLHDQRKEDGQFAGGRVRARSGGFRPDGRRRRGGGEP